MVIFIVLFSVIVVGIVIILAYYFKQKKYNNFILENSICLKQLNEINSRYKFYPYINYNQSNTYDNEKLYDNISCEDFLIYQLQFHSIKISNQINKINANKKLYSDYLSEVKNILQFGQFQSPTGNLNLVKLVKKEKLLIKKQIYNAPVTQFTLSVTLYCSKINGQVYSRKSEIFSAREVLTLIKRINRKDGNFYTDREIWEAICRVERGKVSNKLRFLIYDRDGHRCRRCGISERFAQLEIDHIIPISKGGKTTYDNLQTLCHKCNVEKSNSLY